MGVPLVTRCGETFAARVAASLLHAVGLPQLVCDDDEAYVALVIALAGDASRRAALRRHLDQGRSLFPLFDGGRFASDLEHLYRRMAQRYRDGRPPAALPAEAAPAPTQVSTPAPEHATRSDAALERSAA
jgi:predicted O-linked N-acetylglucosamine transferase (SPINDLY family)